MNNSILRSMVDERLRGRRRALADESDEAAPARVPPAWAVLAAVSDIRRKRAAHAFMQTERDLQRAHARLKQAEFEAARLYDRISSIELEWHRERRHGESVGLDLHRERAAQTQREALANERAEHVRACMQDRARAGEALEHARAWHSALARKDETLHALRQRLLIGGDE